MTQTNPNEKLVLGTVQFGLDYGISNKSGAPGATAVNEILKMASEAGIKILDTAEVYGEAPARISDFHQRYGRSFDIINKVKVVNDGLSTQMACRLSSLGIASFEALLFHNFESFLNHRNDERITALKETGLTRKLGVSLYTNEELEQVLEVGGADLVQLPFNLLDNHYRRGPLMAEARRQGVEVHVRSVFLQGLFFMRGEELPSRLAPLSRYLDVIHEISRRSGVSVGSLALNYALSQPYIDRVLFGVNKLGELEQNLREVNQDIDPGVWSEIGERVRVNDTEFLNPVNWT